MRRRSGRREPERIRKINELLQRNAADIACTQQLKAIYRRLIEQETWNEARKQACQHAMAFCEQDIDSQRESVKLRTSFAQTIKSTIDNPVPAWKMSSAYSKSRGHWIASLATSGALPNWSSGLGNSADGHVWEYGKGIPYSNDSKYECVMSVTEKELTELFEDGKHPMPGSPLPSPHDQGTSSATPDQQAGPGKWVVPENGVGSHNQRWYPRSKATIRYQCLTSELIGKSVSGTSGAAVKVKVINFITNGKKEEKEISG